MRKHDEQRCTVRHVIPLGRGGRGPGAWEVYCEDGVGGDWVEMWGGNCSSILSVVERRVLIFLVDILNKVCIVL